MSTKLEQFISNKVEQLIARCYHEFPQDYPVHIGIEEYDVNTIVDCNFAANQLIGRIFAEECMSDAKEYPHIVCNWSFANNVYQKNKSTMFFAFRWINADGHISEVRHIKITVEYLHDNDEMYIDACTGVVKSITIETVDHKNTMFFNQGAMVEEPKQEKQEQEKHEEEPAISNYYNVLDTTFLCELFDEHFDNIPPIYRHAKLKKYIESKLGIIASELMNRHMGHVVKCELVPFVRKEQNDQQHVFTINIELGRVDTAMMELLFKAPSEDYIGEIRLVSVTYLGPAHK